MYQHVLIATDGSALAEKAIEAGVQLAATLSARLTIAHVGSPYAPPLYAGDFVPSTYLSAEEHETRVREAGEEILARAAAAAVARNLTCTTDFTIADHPYQGVLDIAARNQCDLIVMASHGRSGWGAVLLGSETQKILTHSKIDVLVIRREVDGAVAETAAPAPAVSSPAPAPSPDPIPPEQPPF